MTYNRDTFRHNSTSPNYSSYPQQPLPYYPQQPLPGSEAFRGPSFFTRLANFFTSIFYFFLDLPMFVNFILIMGFLLLIAYCISDSDSEKENKTIKAKPLSEKDKFYLLFDKVSSLHKELVKLNDKLSYKDKELDHLKSSSSDDFQKSYNSSLSEHQELNDKITGLNKELSFLRERLDRLKKTI